MSEAFTEIQIALREVASGFFSSSCTPSEVRKTIESDGPIERGRWKELAGLDLLGIAIPEEHGGLGFDAPEQVLVLEESGYAGLPEPLLESTAIVAPVIAAFGTDEQKGTWLEGLATGELLGSVQLMGAPVAPYGAAADVLLIEQAGELHIVAGTDVVAEPVRSRDGARKTARIEVAADAATPLVDPVAACRMAQRRAAAGSAAVLNGISRRMLDMSVAYAQERRQFDRLIGSFQAVKHMLAEVALEVETARPAAWYAATAIAEGLADVDVACSTAKAAASSAARLANTHALQVHGGIGFTWEYDLHLWLHQGKALETAYGSESYHNRLLADRLLSTDDLMRDYGPSLDAA